MIFSSSLRPGYVPLGSRVYCINLETGDIAAGGPTTDAQAGARLEGRAVMDCLGELPARQREALLLVAEGLSYAEIAEVEGTTLSAVKAAVHRARGNLAGRLAKRSEG